MPPSGNPEHQALLDRVTVELTALEAAVADAGRAIVAGDGEALERSFMDQRRQQHAVENAMYDARSARSREFDKHVFGRLALIGETRDRHIAALQSQRDETGKKLATLNNWKRASRKWLEGFQERMHGRLDQRR